MDQPDGFQTAGGRREVAIDVIMLGHLSERFASGRSRRLEQYQVAGGERGGEAAAEADEELLDKFLEDGTLDEADIRKGLRKRTLANEIVVAMCGSAFKNKGVQALLDAVIDYMPAPIDVPAIRGIPFSAR